MRKYLFSLTSQERKALIIIASLFLLGTSFYHYTSLKTHFILRNKEIGSRETKGRILLDINRASLSELTQIPHIGIKIAGRIIDYRRENGEFRTKGELLNIKGIGPKKLKIISKFIRIN